MKSRKWTALSFVLAAVACSGGGDVDLGDDDPARSGESLEDYAAIWEGYAEAFQFEDGSDEIRLALDEEGEGILVVGTAAAPVTNNPNVAPGEADTPESVATGSLMPGFEYSVRLASVESARLRAWVLPGEAYRAWCEIQTPILDEVNSMPGDPQYGCVENAGFTRQDDSCFQSAAPIDCGKLFACMMVCACAEQGCSVPEPTDVSGYGAELDAALADDGNALVGTLLLGGSRRITVRMTRQ